MNQVKLANFVAPKNVTKEGKFWIKTLSTTL